MHDNVRYIRWAVVEVIWTQASEDHIARHGVEPYEVHEVLANRFRRARTGRDDARHRPHPHGAAPARRPGAG
jgi:hypothetical protein